MRPIKSIKLIALIAATVAFSAAFAQDPPHNIEMSSNITPAEFGAANGNDCWGYVSPSGREYALMSLNNMLAVVEVSDPDQPIIIGRVYHASNTWGDVKVYKQYAYFATERHGSGLQVIDLTQVDDGIVTLVKTDLRVPDAHNLAVDEDSGFLYACAVNGGTGTTMCLDLSDPANPEPIGAGSMTWRGLHDMQVVTYDSGPYAGRQIMFASTGGWGFSIWDVTDKNNPFFVSRMTYPGLSYNHQGWLSEDKQLWYMNDELDEYYHLTPTTRSLVVDVSDIGSPFLASTFTTGKPSIDHNLYVKCGFIFEANYTTGLRIFDGNDDPLNPVQTGWFDTFPSHDDHVFGGAWSNFPFFPSGTVIVSDIQRGLFVFDVSAATLRAITSDTHTVDTGTVLSGDNGSLAVTDTDVLVVRPEANKKGSRPSAAITVDATAPCEHASQLTLKVTSQISSLTPKRGRANVRQRISMFNWETDKWEKMDNTVVFTQRETLSLQIENPEAYINDDTFAVRVRVEYFGASARVRTPWTVGIDQISWTWNP